MQGSPFKPEPFLLFSLHTCSGSGKRVGGLHARTLVRESAGSAEQKLGATENPFAGVTHCVGLRAAPSSGITMVPIHSGGAHAPLHSGGPMAAMAQQGGQP